MRKNEQAYNTLKIIHDLDLIKKMRSGEPFFPKTIRVDLNTICNHDCNFCLYQSSNDGLRGIGMNQDMPPKTQIPKDRLIELIGEFKECGVESLVFLGGGEPTIYPALEEVIQKTDNLGLEYGMITNGSRLDRMIPFKDSSNFKWYRASLDAATEKTWAKIHVPKGHKEHDFDKILDNIKAVQSERPDFLRGLSFIVGPDNYHEVYDFVKLAKDLGVNNVRFGLEYGKGFGDRNSDLIDRVVEQIDTTGRFFGSSSLKIFNKVTDRNTEISNDRDYTTCGYKDISANLGADLNIYTCCFGKYNPSHKMGSVKDKTFKQMWLEDRLEYLKTFDVSKCPPCWFGETNKILEYATEKDPVHVKFIN